MKTKFYRIISLLTILVIMCTTISFPAHAETHTLNNPWKNVNNYITWDCVYFGSYNQNGTGEKTRIKWRVLEVNGNDAFIMADKALDVYPYYDNDSYFYTNVTWKNSSVRAWLNSTFINNAFSIGEQSAIIETNIKTTSYDSNKFSETTNDKVYLLSVDECKNTKYGFQSDIILKDNSRACKITEKARCDSNRLLKNAKVCTWMLRTVCDDNSNICTRERCIGTMGELSSGLLYEHYAAIRPVLHLNINSDSWQYAGRVTSAPDNVIDDEITIDYKKYKEDAEKEGVLNVRVCDDEFLKDSISEYNNDIARYAIGLSTLVYADTTAIVNGLKKLGFDDENTSENEYLDRHYRPDTTNESEGLYSPSWIVHKKLKSGGDECTLLVVAIRGTSKMEWIDNFNSEKGDTHVGFERAADYIVKNIEYYVFENGLKDDNIKILITGHSRGAAAANLVGKKLDDNKNNYSFLGNMDKICVYTFATPNVAKNTDQNLSPENKIYKNIYNIVNPEDFVTKVLPTKWGYSRYGTTYVLPSSTTDSNYYGSYYDSLCSEFSCYTGGYPYIPYEEGMIPVSDLIWDITYEVGDVNDYYSKDLGKNILLDTTLHHLFVNFMGNFMCGNSVKKTEALLTVEQAFENKYGKLGVEICSYFVNNQVLDPHFEHAHMPEMYLAAMNVIEKSDLDIKKQRITLGGIVNCPIDVTIKDSKGAIVGKISNNVVDTSIANRIQMKVNGDSKLFYLPIDEDYSIELTGNNNGKMDYSLRTISPDEGEVKRIFYGDVPVVKGETYKQTCSSNGIATTINELKDKNGETVRETSVISEGEYGSLSYEVTVDGNGFAEGLSYVTKGDYVTLVAYPEDDSEFVGWYDLNGKLVWEEDEFSFSATKSEKYVAKFKDKGNSSDPVNPDDPDDPVNPNNPDNPDNPDDDKNQYTITFDGNGGKVDVNSIKVTSKKEYGPLPIATRNGYIFAGWYLDKDGGEKVKETTIFDSNKDQILYAHWDYIDIVVNQKFNITEYFKEFDNSLNIKKYKIEKIDMDLSSGKTSKAKISKKGVLTVSKEGLIRVTPLVKDGKKYVPVEGIEPYVLNVVKPGVLKKIKTVPESEITVNNLITNFPANSNTVKLSIPKKTKVATYDEQNNSVKLIKKGKVKITVTITNIQGNSVKYSCTVNCKLKP